MGTMGCWLEFRSSATMKAGGIQGGFEILDFRTPGEQGRFRGSLRWLQALETSCSDARTGLT